MTRKKAKDSRLLTDVELELMQVIWQNGNTTVNEILENLPNSRNLAYTSVSTILRILEQKDILRSEKEGRGHRYFPLMTKEKFESLYLQHTIQNVFEGEPSLLVKRLVNSEKISEKEIEEIESFLRSRK